MATPEDFGSLKGWYRGEDQNYTHGDDVTEIVQSSAAKGGSDPFLTDDPGVTFHTDGPNGKSYIRWDNNEDFIITEQEDDITTYLSDSNYTVFTLVRVVEASDGINDSFFPAGEIKYGSDVPTQNTVWETLETPLNGLQFYGYDDTQTFPDPHFVATHGWLTTTAGVNAIAHICLELTLLENVWTLVIQWFDGTDFHVRVMTEFGCEEQSHAAGPFNERGDSQGTFIEFPNLGGSWLNIAPITDIAEWGTYDEWIGSAGVSSIITYIKEEYDLALVSCPSGHHMNTAVIG